MSTAFSINVSIPGACSVDADDLRDALATIVENAIHLVADDYAVGTVNWQVGEPPVVLSCDICQLAVSRVPIEHGYVDAAGNYGAQSPVSHKHGVVTP